MTQSLHVEVRHDGAHSLVTVHGRAFYDTVEPLRAALTSLLHTERPRIVLDLSAVEICDSSGLNLLIDSHRAATAREGWLRLVGLQPMVRRVVDITNLDRLLSIHSTVDDALHDGSADT